MKILFLNAYFPPYRTIASLRTGKTAKLLHERGHDIKVVTLKQETLKSDFPLEIPKENLYQVTWLNLDNYLLKLLKMENKNKIIDATYNSKGKKISIKNKFMQFIFKIYKIFFRDFFASFSQYKNLFSESKNIIKEWKPDIIYASGLPKEILIVASNLNKKYNIPFVAEFRDLWADNHYNNKSYISEYLEKRTLKNAHSIISVSKPLVDKLQQKYPDIPCFEVRNAYDEEDFVFNQKNKNSKITILYTGMIYQGKQDPSLLFEVISQNEYLKENVICKFYGNGLLIVKDLAKKYNIEHCVEVYDSIDRIEILKLQSQSDILLLLTWDNPLEKGVFTGKLFEYIGSAKPILGIGAVDDVASHAINENGFGLSTNNRNDIYTFIKNIKDEEFLEKINNNYLKNRKFFERNYQVDTLEEIFKKEI